MRIGRKVAAAVETFYCKDRKIPDDLDETGFAEPLPPTVKALNMSSRNVTVSITLAGPALDDKVLQFVPALDSDHRIVWTCSGVDT